MGVDVASNAFIVTGPVDSSPSVTVDDPSLAENPRKCCVSFKLTPIHVSIPCNSVDEEVDHVKNSDLIQSDLVNSDAVEQETFVNSGLPLLGDPVIFDPVDCDPLVTSYSQVNDSVKANPFCPDVSCVSETSVSTIQLVNLALQQNDSAQSNSTLESEGNQGVFLNGPEHSEEMFAPEDIKPCEIVLQCTETADRILDSENWTGAELQGNQSSDGTLVTDVTSGLTCLADHNKEFVGKVDCILKENGGCHFNNLYGIYSNLQCEILLDSSMNNHNKPADLANETGDKTDECAVSQVTSEPVGNWITNGQKDGLRKLNIGVYLNPLKGSLSCNDQEVLEKDICNRDIDMDGASTEEDLLVSKVPYKDVDGRLQNPKQSGCVLSVNSQKMDFRSIKTFDTKTGLGTQSDSENSKLQKEPDLITEISVHCSVQSNLMAPDNLAKPDQLLKKLPTVTSGLGSQQADINSADLAYCLVSEQAGNLNSDSFSTSDLSFWDDDNDDLYSRVKARRRESSAKRSSVDHNPVRQTWTWTTDKRKPLTEVDYELMPQCEADSTKSSCKEFVTQRDDKHFKKDFENNSVSQSSIDSHGNSARHPSINLEGNMAKQSTFTEYSGNLLTLHLCETVSNYKHDYIAVSSKQFGIQKGSKCAKTSLESNSEIHPTFINSSETSSWEAFSNSETDNHEGSAGNLVVLTGRKHVKKSSENSSVKQSSFTDNSIANSSTDLSSSTLKRVRRSGRLKDRENSEQRGLCSSREVFSSLPDVDAIRHAVEVVRHNVMDKSQCFEEFSLPDVEYHGCKNVKCKSLFVSQSFLSTQTVENSIQSSVENLLEVEATKICVSTVDGVNERDENSTKILENKMQVVSEMRHDVNAILTNDFISTMTDSSQVIADTYDKLLNHTLTQ